jgi:outer membrane immunogenic protein
MKKVLLGSVATGALALAGAVSGALTAGSANAADLRMPLKAPPPPAPIFSWSGCYVGANWGWGWGKEKGQGLSFGSATSFGSFDNKLSGPIFGGQLGCNYQWPGSNFVIGIEGMAAAADIEGTGQSFYSTDARVHTKVDAIYSVTGRLGWNGWDPQVLFYIKGGWAGTHQRSDWQFDATRGNNVNFVNVSRSGWTVGGGFEWALTFAPKWSVFAEYDYYSLGHKNIGIGGSANFSTLLSTNTNMHISTVKVGVNYRLFSPF